MFLFYKKAFALVVVCLLLSVVVQYFCITLSERNIPLLPQEESDILWQPVVTNDSERGGASTHLVRDASYAIDYEYTAKTNFKYPYVVFALRFDKHPNSRQNFVDLSDFSSATFRIRCSPNNILSFTAYMVDDEDTKKNLGSERIASAYFACEKKSTTVDIDLKRLDVPDWWLEANAKPLSSKKYNLNKTLAIAFWNSAQSPVEVPSSVTVDSLVLKGRAWWIIYLGESVLVLLWIGVAILCIKRHALALATDIKRQLQKDLPLVAYQQLFVESHKDKEKGAVLHFIATEYANPDLNLETAIAALGTNRNKINELLKAEIGLTFTAYLNKVRLTEAARLLAANQEFNIAEAAYSVGYNNVSYFNKLFKAEYGCTPKAFQTVAVEKSA